MAVEVLKKNRFRLNEGPTAFQGLNFHTNMSKNSISGPPPKGKINQDPFLPIKKLTTSEMEAWRKQGLIYYWYDKFTPGYEC